VIGDAPPSRLGPGTGPVLERLGGEVAADDAPGTHGNA
jgi:hypothetical protein